MFSVLLTTMYLLSLLLLLAIPVHAHHTPEAEHLPGEDICAAVADELDHGVTHGLITQEEANLLILRCVVNYQ